MESSAKEVKVVKVTWQEGKWKVIYMLGDKPAELHAYRGDEIRWDIEGDDAHFQFCDETLFGTFYESGSSKQPLTLTVTNDATKGKHCYAVFCTTWAIGYAEQFSPPVIIID